jgi:hypothetical protein
MKIFIITQQKTQNLAEFIAFWSQLYDKKSDKEYNKNINKDRFSEDDIMTLFEWKNQMKLSSLKKKSLNENVIKKISKINEYKSKIIIDKINFLNEFLDEFSSVSAVWRIFLLHIIKPDTYPIYDQHVHRAYNIVHELPFDKINSEIKDSEKIDFYKKEYYPFISNLRNKYELKEIDEALVSFGQFFSKNNNIKLFF